MLIRSSLAFQFCGLVTFAFFASSGGCLILCRCLLLGRSSSFGAGTLLCLLFEGPPQWAEHLEEQRSVVFSVSEFIGVCLSVTFKLFDLNSTCYLGFGICLMLDLSYLSSLAMA